jgi:hypothetical protein
MLPRALPTVTLALCILAAYTYPCWCGSNRIRVLVMGDLDRGPPVISSYRQDPLVVCSKVPSNIEMGTWDQKVLESVGGRIVRQYFPRSRTELVENYDFLVYEDAWLDPYRPEQVADMRYAIEKEGLGAFVTCGNQLVTYTSWAWYTWHQSVLRELMPVEFTEKARASTTHMYAGFTIKIVKYEPPVLAMFKEFKTSVGVSIDGSGMWRKIPASKPAFRKWAS